MGYNKQYSYGGGQSWGGSQRAPYRSNSNRSNSRNYTSSQQSTKKRSGCSLKVCSDGKTIVLSGWKIMNRCLVQMYARPYKGTKTVASSDPRSKGYHWTNLFVTLTNTKTGEIQKLGGLFCEETKRLYIKELNLVANPRAPRGGYFGKHISRDYR